MSIKQLFVVVPAALLILGIGAAIERDDRPVNPRVRPGEGE